MPKYHCVKCGREYPGGERCAKKDCPVCTHYDNPRIQKICSVCFRGKDLGWTIYWRDVVVPITP